VVASGSRHRALSPILGSLQGQCPYCGFGLGCMEALVLGGTLMVGCNSSSQPSDRQQAFAALPGGCEGAN